MQSVESKEVESLLFKQDIKWQGFRPGKHDIEEVFEEAKQVLSVEPVGAQYQRGGLIIRKETSETYDVYVFVGSLN